MEVPENGVASSAVTEDELNANLDVYEGKTNPHIPLPDIEDFKKMKPADWEKGVERAAADKTRRKERKRKQREKAEAKKKKVS